MTSPCPLGAVCLDVGNHAVVEMLCLDLEANGEDEQIMIRLMMGAPEDSCIKQAGSVVVSNPQLRRKREKRTSDSDSGPTLYHGVSAMRATIPGRDIPHPQSLFSTSHGCAAIQWPLKTYDSRLIQCVVWWWQAQQRLACCTSLRAGGGKSCFHLCICVTECS